VYTGWGVIIKGRYVLGYTDNLLDVDGEETLESKRNLFRFYNYVKSLLPNYDVNIMLAASKTLGQIAEIGGAAFGERFMDFEVPAAIELLQGDKQESPRYAGVLILKELARNSPTYFHSHINLVFDKILVPLRDPRLIVREGAAELLAACLEIVTQRERQTRSPYLFKILQDAQLGLKMSQPEIIHGSLLTYRELLLHGGMVRCNIVLLVFLLVITYFYIVYERDISRYCGSNTWLQIAQGSSCPQNGDHSHPDSRRL
jgi:FKBP12-rapamycin complex-associated protein